MGNEWLGNGWIGNELMGNQSMEGEMLIQFPPVMPPAWDAACLGCMDAA